jgi:hypothetical protein
LIYLHLRLLLMTMPIVFWLFGVSLLLSSSLIVTLSDLVVLVNDKVWLSIYSTIVFYIFMCFHDGSYHNLTSKYQKTYNFFVKASLLLMTSFTVAFLIRLSLLYFWTIALHDVGFLTGRFCFYFFLSVLCISCPILGWEFSD